MYTCTRKDPILKSQFIKIILKAYFIKILNWNILIKTLISQYFATWECDRLFWLSFNIFERNHFENVYIESGF